MKGLTLSVVGLLFACGGRASRSAPEAAEAGATATDQAGSANAGAMASGGAKSGGGASAGGGATGSSDAPSTATLLGPSGEAEAPATPTAIGPCFVGFATFVSGMYIDFVAFVQEPGDYPGDSTHILYLSARLPDGRLFSASTNSQPYGEIELHAVAVSPRFSGAVNGELYDREDPSAPPLTLALTFDVKGSSGCKL